MISCREMAKLALLPEAFGLPREWEGEWEREREGEWERERERERECCRFLPLSLRVDPLIARSLRVVVLEGINSQGVKRMWVVGGDKWGR